MISPESKLILSSLRPGLHLLLYISGDTASVLTDIIIIIITRIYVRLLLPVDKMKGKKWNAPAPKHRLLFNFDLYIYIYYVYLMHIHLGFPNVLITITQVHSCLHHICSLFECGCSDQIKHVLDPVYTCI